MKKLLLAALIVLMALTLSACKEDETTQDQIHQAENPVSAKATPSPTPTMAPTPTPFPWVAAEDYVMTWKSYEDKGFNVMVPYHWNVVSDGNRYIVFEEPVPEGESCFRVAFGNKKVSGNVDASEVKAELKDYLAIIRDSEFNTDFQLEGSITRDRSLVKFKGPSTFYHYIDEKGNKIRGFAIMATYNRRIYLMNFSGPEERFDELSSIGQKMMSSMSRT